MLKVIFISAALAVTTPALAHGFHMGGGRFGFGHPGQHGGHMFGPGSAIGGHGFAFGHPGRGVYPSENFHAWQGQSGFGQEYQRPFSPDHYGPSGYGYGPSGNDGSNSGFGDFSDYFGDATQLFMPDNN